MFVLCYILLPLLVGSDVRSEGGAKPGNGNRSGVRGAKENALRKLAKETTKNNLW